MSRLLILFVLLCVGCASDLSDNLHRVSRDCSLVRWDRGHGFCRPPDLPPAPPPFCSRSLAGVDCWAEPAALVNPPRGLADGPRGLTEAQETNRTRIWPRF